MKIISSALARAAPAAPPRTRRPIPRGVSTGIASARIPKSRIWQRHPRTHAGRKAVSGVPVAEQKTDPMSKFSKNGEVDIRLRGEAEAPWRPVRLVLYGFSVVSASVGALIALPQLIAAVGEAPNALPKEQVIQNLGINVGAIALFSYLFVQDKKAEAVQLARLGREEKLGAQYVELIGGKLVRVRELRSFARVVVVAGSTSQVNEAIQSATKYKKDLAARGIMLIALPIYGEKGKLQIPEVPDSKEDDLKRFIGVAARLDGWTKWFDEQADVANASTERGLYIGLRLDGRVRASGKGSPPWEKFIREIAPVEGMWKGFLDGMDGVV